MDTIDNVDNMDKEVSSSDLLRNLTPTDFRNLGAHQLAYIRPIVVDNRTAWSIHAADGTPLSIMDDHDVAVALVRHNEMQPVTVH